MARITSATAVALLFFSSIAGAQDLGELRKLVDAGKYQQAIDAAGASPDARATYLVAQSAQRLSPQHAAAKQAYEQLAGRPESDPWHDIGQSGLALMSSNVADAVEAANRAVDRDDSIPEAHYQAGLAMMNRQDWQAAASHFEKAAQLDPSWAYAHYYAGLAYSKIKRLDLVASHFQTFLKLAPQAPERGEVQSIMRTLGAK
jgi:tetratricopeptide (TPR) repeat protein